jgi:RNA polymerase sigma-70 factor, ECF subfamily
MTQIIERQPSDLAYLDIDPSLPNIDTNLDPLLLNEPFLLPSEKMGKTVEKAKSGDLEAMGELYLFFFPRIQTYALNRLNRIEDSEDVASEVMYKMISKLDTYQDRGFPFGSWVFRIASNEVVSHTRKIKRQITIERTAREDPSHPWSQVTFQDKYPDPYQSQKIKEAVNALPNEQRKVAKESNCYEIWKSRIN